MSTASRATTTLRIVAGRIATIVPAATAAPDRTQRRHGTAFLGQTAQRKKSGAATRMFSRISAVKPRRTPPRNIHRGRGGRPGEDARKKANVMRAVNEISKDAFMIWPS